jgi:hypothetical protein
VNHYPPLGLLVLIRGAIYNPLCKLVWIARTFVLASIYGFLRLYGVVAMQLLDPLRQGG